MKSRAATIKYRAATIKYRAATISDLILVWAHLAPAASELALHVGGALLRTYT